LQVPLAASRKLSIQETDRKLCGAGVAVTGKHEHARSNSNLSKKSLKLSKGSFKIDLSKLSARNENQTSSDINHRLSQEKPQFEIGRTHFEFEYIIGNGGFGRVWSTLMKKTGMRYAMKEMNKTKIIAKKSIPSVLNERSLLSELNHPFIVNMVYAFQDRERLYLVMDLLAGGDLRFHMGVRHRFRESEAKFFIGCLLIGLEFLHLKSIIHRDIKPENLVFDEMGYLRITDLGVARVLKSSNSTDTSGTPGYMAPEVMCRQNHGFPVDYYAVGIIAYELMLGRRPYNGANRKEIRDQILSKQVQVRAEEVPLGWSGEAAHFINRVQGG
jgi:serine/threonine protein kinase